MIDKFNFIKWVLFLLVLGAYRQMEEEDITLEILEKWEEQGEAKIILKVDSLSELE